VHEWYIRVHEAPQLVEDGGKRAGQIEICAGIGGAQKTGGKLHMLDVVAALTLEANRASIHDG